MSDRPDDPRAALRQAELAELGHWSALLLHELRQPLLAMQLRVQLAEVRGGLDPAALKAEVAHLIDLVEYFGAFSPTAAPATTVDVRAEIEAALRVASPRAGRHQLKMEADLGATPLHVVARPAAVRQIVLNLVHNALDAVRGVSDAAVTLSAGSDAGGVWLRVQDDGPGVDEAARPHIFDAWYTTKGQDGTGLGLYLARSLARADGGDLALEAGTAGASFLVRWPGAVARR